MLPLGSTLLLWRHHRRLSQGQLAVAAGITRPNLSALERGRRDITLSTLRALAAALGVTPGVLADGQVPVDPMPQLGRVALESIAEAVADDRSLSGSEETTRRALSAVLRSRLQAARHRKGAVRGGKRVAGIEWLRLKASLPPEVLKSLISRVDKALERQT